MNEEAVNIKDVKVSAYTIPTDGPESDGTIKWNSTTMVLVEIEAGGKKGIGYSYADLSSAFYIEKSLKEIVVGKDAMQIPFILKTMIESVRNSGNYGVIAMAISAVDNALWDLKAKILNVPLVALFGKVRDDFWIYGSGGFTSYSIKKLQKQLGDWAEEGIKQVKMKIGREPKKDLERVEKAREAIGKDCALFVDANGAYSAKQALELANKFAALDVTWFEEPVPASDLKGLNFIREHAPDKINIAAGEYGYNLPYFEQMLDAGAVDVLQADATRCGGISVFVKAGNTCEAHQLPFSSHCAPSLHLHPGLSLDSFFTAEYFYDHVRIENMLFDGTAKPVNGALHADMSRWGFGLEFKYKDAEKYKV
ncbi:MAG TPA: enolase C-terminal domain-like protein [Hanamia sp.]|nr:enolase C-terminal domain-like protein [Hanamia sp.]